MHYYSVNSVGSTFEYPDLYHKVEGGIKLFRHISVINIIPVTLVRMFPYDNYLLVYLPLIR